MIRKVLLVTVKSSNYRKKYEQKIKKFESLKFTVVPVQMRHIYTQGEGIHCATLDTVRDSKLESYF
jgi:hypothetical protein